MRLLTVLRREPPLNVAREALWRVQKRWHQMRLHDKLQRVKCPVVYRPIGYYRAEPSEVSERASVAVHTYANAVSSGQFPWFAYGPVQLGFPPRWNLDFVSGKTWPEAAAEKIQIVRKDGSDVKVPWELSRLQFLPVLGKAWRLSSDECYRLASKRLLGDWIEKNPVGLGVNWTIAMEAALRAISICLFLDLLAPFRENEGAWIRHITASLWQHLLFIEAHNEFSYLSRTNHYLSNIVGLFCLSSFLHGIGMEERRLYYRNLVEQEIVQQVYEDGGHYEASIGYHVLILQMFTTSLLLMRSQNFEPTLEFSVRLQRMYQLLAALADGDRRVPQLGDCDDGKIELLSDDLEQLLVTTPGDKHSLTISSLLGVGEAIFGDAYGGRKDEAGWYGALSGVGEAQSADTDCRSSVLFPKSGLAIARNGQAEVLFCAMPNGAGGRGTHTHNDKLSFILRLGREDLLHDSGTGCYTRDTELRNTFRSTAAHNTVQIDGEEQNRFSKLPGDVFRICDDAHVTPITIQETNGTVTLRASHDGYSRLGVTHMRILELRSECVLRVEDHFTGSGRHDFEARFHLRWNWQVEVEQNLGGDVSCRIWRPNVSATLSYHAPIELELSCIPGQISTAYGVMDAAKTILVRGSFEAPLKLLSCIFWTA